MELSETDQLCFERAVYLAEEAEQENNLPIGAVIAYQGEIIAEGKNTIWHPKFDATRHAEMEAFRAVPAHLWPHSREFTLYTTLEPCIMCTGAILMHFIGRVQYAAADPYGGASTLFGHMPPFFDEQLGRIIWIGPVYQPEGERLYARVMNSITRRGERDR